MASGRYAMLAGLSEDAFGRDFDHFEFGLQRVLDGLEALVARRAAERAEDDGRSGSRGGGGAD